MPIARTHGRARRDQAHPVGTGTGLRPRPRVFRVPSRGGRTAEGGRADDPSVRGHRPAPNPSGAADAQAVMLCDRRLPCCPVLLRTGEARR
jgi:hypothetical protein